MNRENIPGGDLFVHLDANHRATRLDIRSALSVLMFAATLSVTFLGAAIADGSRTPPNQTSGSQISVPEESSLEPRSTTSTESGGATPFVRAEDFLSSSFRGLHLGVRTKPIEADGLSPSIRELGANVVRVMIRLETCEGCSAWDIPGQQLQNLSKIVDMGARDGFRVVITLMPEGRGRDGRSILWESSSLKSDLIAIWQNLATQYRENRQVAAYDLLNEPFPPGDPKKNDSWTKYAIDLIGAIRQIDPHHVIIVETSPHARPQWFSYAQRLPFENLVYSLHMYEPHALTHQGVDRDAKIGVDYPGVIDGGTYVDRAWIETELTQVIQFAKTHRVPIFVGEFGCVRWAPRDACRRYLQDVITIMEREGWSWAYHSYREWHGWDAEIDSREQQSRRRSGGAPTISLLRQYFYRNKAVR